METSAILSKLEKAAPGKILEKGRFGRSELLSVWVELSSVHSMAEAVATDPDLRLNWLENLSVAEVGNALVLSWFLRSRDSTAQLVVRSTVAIRSSSAISDAPSVQEVWPMARKFEQDAAELFGIRFKKKTGEAIEKTQELLAGIEEFPMRKSFVLEKEDAE